MEEAKAKGKTEVWINKNLDITLRMLCHKVDHLIILFPVPPYRFICFFSFFFFFKKTCLINV